MLGNGPVRFGRRALEKDPLSRHLASAPPHHPDGVDALLQIARLVDDQRRLWVAKVLDHVVAKVVAHLVLVPYRPAQQVLHPVRVGVAGGSAIVQSFLAGQPAARARTPLPAAAGPPERTGPRPGASNSSSPAPQRAGSTSSTLWPAATV
jgi:hypothetical protein